jgi:hypothetical protein
MVKLLDLGLRLWWALPWVGFALGRLRLQWALPSPSVGFASSRISNATALKSLKEGGLSILVDSYFE